MGKHSLTPAPIPRAASFTTTDKSSPCTLTLAKQLRPRLAISRRIQRTALEQIPESSFTPASNGSSLARTWSSSAPASTPQSETCALNRARHVPRLRPASAESLAVPRPSPRRYSRAGTKSSIGRMALGASTRNATTARRSCASSTRTSTAAPWSSGDSKWLRSTDSLPPQRRRPWAAKSHTSHSAPSSNRGRVALPLPLRHTESSGKSSGRCAGVRSLACSCGCRVFVTSNHLTGIARRLPFSLPPAPIRLCNS